MDDMELITMMDALEGGTALSQRKTINLKSSNLLSRSAFQNAFGPETSFTLRIGSHDICLTSFANVTHLKYKPETNTYKSLHHSRNIENGPEWQS
jgi:hypothetical protein